MLKGYYFISNLLMTRIIISEDVQIQSEKL
jgi:hypothetical protein